MFKSIRRLKGPNLYHHIYNRGNDRHPIFKNEADYERYLSYLFSYSKKYRMDVIAYALLVYHVHLFIYDYAGNISKFIEDLHGLYAQIYNKIHNRVGHVFGSRFRNKIVDANNYGIWLSRYIHRQAVEAGAVQKPEEYKWTSYRCYIGLEKSRFLKSEIILSQFGNKINERIIAYKNFVEGNDEGPIDWKRIELSYQSIIGGREFIEEINEKLSKGRPKTKYQIDPLRLICRRLNVSAQELRHPKNQRERKLRKQTLILLKQKHNLGVREIARALCISPALVSLILNDKWY